MADTKLTLAAQVVASFKDHPDVLTHVANDKPLASAISTVFRPYLQAAVTGKDPKGVRDDSDRREKRWLVSLEFWDVPRAEMIAASEGREWSDAERSEVARYGGEVFRGLEAVAGFIAFQAKHAFDGHVPDAFSEAVLSKALAYLRPTITRQQGRATMRRTTADGRYHLVCDIFREDAFPKG